jgi:ABC-2 type transport system ATP-binding protein
VDHVVAVSELHKRYGAVEAVAGLSFEVAAGTTFGLVGPNGAGKTTTIECLEGLRKPDRGSVRVLGMDPQESQQKIFERCGVQLQESSMYTRIRCAEALDLFGSFFPNPRPTAQLLAEFGLTDKARTFYNKLSGGQKRKLLTAVALVGRPELVILDEPTSGLDPRSRREFWAALERYQEQGLTVLLTTHDLVEAEERCDVVCIIDHGRIVAEGSPGQLLESYHLGTRVAGRLPADAALQQDELRGHPGVERVEVADNRVLLFGGGNGFAQEASRLLEERGAEDLRTRPANLEDLYLILTGRDYQLEGQPDGPSEGREEGEAAA